jgi:16S rRNA (guanine966-N2)-methyltransferase
MAKAVAPRARNQLRIIAGKWRGRKIQFVPVDDLRPTPDRIRETVFNWLQFDIVGKNCLDLFAGSGALGFEALSRGAENLCLVETDPTAIQQLRLNQTTLKAENSQLVEQDVMRFLQRSSQQESQQRYDIIFLDPPYKMQLLKQCIDSIEKNQWLKNHGKLYFEQPKQEPEIELSAAWSISHAKSAGNVSYYLATFCST